MRSQTQKQYLPTTYQSFISSKKKTIKQINNVKPLQQLNLDNKHDQKEEVPKYLRKANQIFEFDSDEEIIDKPVAQKVVYSEYDKLFEEFENSRFEVLVKKINRQIQTIKEQTATKSVKINDILCDLNIQSAENLKILQFQLNKPIEKRSLQRIQKIIGFNKFFSLLNRLKRMAIYQQCFYMEVQEGQYIYKQGDMEDYMYVVLKGCLRQFQKKQTSFEQKLTTNILSHYEGSSFGEAELMGDKDLKVKRRHSVVAIQKSYLLKVDNNFYRDLVTNSDQDDFQKKVSSLLSTNIFFQASKIFITPLLSNLQKKIIKFGEVLVRQGEPVRKLYFIGDGNLKFIYIDRCKRSVKHLNLEDKGKQFTVKKNSNIHQQQRRKKNYSIHSTFYYPKQQNESIKQFPYGKKKICGEEIEYNEQIFFQQIRHGDFFGGKSFLSPEQRIQRSEQSNYFTIGLESKLTVVGSTTFTTVYSLDESKFHNLSDKLQKYIVDGILDNVYFDERDIESKVESRQIWKKYSQKLVANVISEKKERNKINS